MLRLVEDDPAALRIFRTRAETEQVSVLTIDTGEAMGAFPGLPHSWRIEYAGAIYHVMSRGNRRANIFKDQRDYQGFLAALAECCRKMGWQVHAGCLIRNHFHRVIETPRANLVAGMMWRLGGHTKRFNFRHKTCGHLFAGRDQALPVEGSGNDYLRTVCDYLHLWGEAELEQRCKGEKAKVGLRGGCGEKGR